jgi:hypothetical protein
LQPHPWGDTVGLMTKPRKQVPSGDEPPRVTPKGKDGHGSHGNTDDNKRGRDRSGRNPEVKPK